MAGYIGGVSVTSTVLTTTGTRQSKQDLTRKLVGVGCSSREVLLEPGGSAGITLGQAGVESATWLMVQTSGSVEVTIGTSGESITVNGGLFVMLSDPGSAKVPRTVNLKNTSVADRAGASVEWACERTES